MKRLFLLFGCIFLTHLAQAQILTKTQRRQIFARIESFTYHLIKYSGNEDKDTNMHRDSLSAMFAADATHVIDFGEQDKGGARDENMDSYLRQIAQDYRYNIDVRFTQGDLIDCIDTLDGRSAVFVTEKCLSRKGKVNAYSEVIQVTLPENENNYNGYKIREVVFAVDFKYDPNVHYECANLIEVRSEDKEKVQMQKMADTLFYREKYTEAAEAYLHMADRYSKDTYPVLMLQRCRDSLKDDSVFLKQGKRYLAQKQYASAIDWYTGHLIVYPDAPNAWIMDTIRHARNVSADENYAVNMKKALEVYQLHNFGGACYYYSNALKFKPADKTALDSLAHTRVKDIDYANNKIDSAIRIYKENGDNAGTYFKILDEYGKYGTHIGTMEYLSMFGLIFNHNSAVINIMNLQKDKDYNRYKKKYLDNLTAAYNKEKNRTIRKKVYDFIENNVN